MLIISVQSIRGSPLQISCASSTCIPFFLILCPVSLIASVPLNAQLCLLKSGVCWASFPSPSLHCRLETIKVVNRGNSGAHTGCLPIFPELLAVISQYPVSRKPVSELLLFVFCFWLLRKRVNAFPVTPFGLEMEIVHCSF